MSLGKLLATGRSLVGGASSLGRYDISERNRLPKFGSVKNPFTRSATSEPKAAAPAELKSEPTLVPTPENQTVEENVAELIRVTESVCRPEAENIAPAEMKHHNETRQIPQLADRTISNARSEGVLEKVAMVVSWLTNVVAIAAGFAAVVARKVWQLVRGFRWGSIPRNGRVVASVAWVKTKAFSSGLAGLVRRSERKQVFPRLGKPAVQTELSLDTVRVVRNSLEDSDLEIVTAETSTSSQVAPTKPVAEPKRGPVPTALKKITGPLVSVKEFEKALD